MSSWTSKLVGARSNPDPRPGWLGPEADRVRSALGEGAVTWALEVGESITAKIVDAMPFLREGASPVEAISRATTSTTLQALTLIAGIGEPNTTLANEDVNKIAREFALRGLELNDLLKTIRVGYAVLAASFLDAATVLLPPERSSGELRRISLILFEELDEFTGVAASVFLAEQGAWAAGISAARLDLASRIIENGDVDVAHAEEVFDFPLDGPMVAVIAWSAQYSTHDLRGVVESVLHRWGNPESTLIIPVGVQAIWAWGTFAPGSAPNPEAPTHDVGETWVVTGQMANGLGGFRTSHLQARAVEQLVRLRPGRAPTLTSHQDVELEVLLLSDPVSAHNYVERILGPLAAEDVRVADLRATLGRYLDLDHSLARVAAAEHISRNTVTYRVHKALALCGHSGDSTTDVRAALRIYDWLDRPTVTARPSNLPSAKA